MFFSSVKCHLYHIEVLKICNKTCKISASRDTLVLIYFKAFNPVLFNMKAQIQATHVIKKFQVAPHKKLKRKKKKNILSFNKTEFLN